MSTQLLAAGTTEAFSDWFPLDDGESATVLLKPAAGRTTTPLVAVINVQSQNAAGQPVQCTQLVGVNGSVVLTGKGTFRLHRPVQKFAVGADRG